MNEQITWQDLIDEFGTAKALATALGKPYTTVHTKIAANAAIPAEWCPMIEAASEGRITRVQIRPKIFGPINEGSRP